MMKDERARMQTADMKPTLKRMGTEFYGFLRIMWCGVRVQTQLETPQTPALFPPPPTPFLLATPSCHAIVRSTTAEARRAKAGPFYSVAIRTGAFIRGAAACKRVSATKPQNFFVYFVCFVVQKQKTPTVRTVGVRMRIASYASCLNFSVVSSIAKPQPS